jgi:hypothetical protein
MAKITARVGRASIQLWYRSTHLRDFEERDLAFCSIFWPYARSRSDNVRTDRTGGKASRHTGQKEAFDSVGVDRYEFGWNRPGFLYW